MKKLWAGAAVLAGLVIWLATSGSDAPPEPVDVTGPDEVPEKALPAAAALAAGSASASAASTKAPPERRIDRTGRPALKARKASDSLVDRAWNETASRRRFAELAGAPDSKPAEKKYPLDAKGIQAAVRAKKDELRECYEPWLKTQPDLGGRTVVTFDITRDDEVPETARIKEVAVKTSQLEHPFVEGCVQSVMQDLVFDPPKDGKVTVNYPLTFASSDPKPGDGEPSR